MPSGFASSLLFSYRNYADSGVLSENNVSPSDWYESLPLANLQDRQLTKVARSTNLQPDFDVDLLRNNPITFVALLNHNLTTTGDWRVLMSSASDFSVVKYDTGWTKAWPRTESFGAKPWGTFSWNGRITESRANNALLIINAVQARYLRIMLRDLNNGAGYLQAGRLIVDAPWRPTTSARFGWKLGFSDRSTKSRSRGGQVWTNRVEEGRILTFDIAGISEDEIYSNGYSINNIKGTTGDLYVTIGPDDALNRHRYGLYGTQVKPGDISHRTHKDFAQPFSIEESL